MYSIPLISMYIFQYNIVLYLNAITTNLFFICQKWRQNSICKKKKKMQKL